MSGPDDQDAGRKILFQKLSADCIEVSKYALVDQSAFDPRSPQLIAALERLYSQLRKYSQSDLFNAQMASYVFYPLSHIFRKEVIGDRIAELVMQCLELLISNGWTTSLNIDTARQLLSILLFLVAGTPDSKDALVISNEAKLAGASAMGAIFRAAVDSNTPDSIEEFKSLAMVPHAISTLLDLIRHGHEMVDLQIEAINALDAALFRLLKTGDSVAQVLPGVMSTFTRVLSGGKGIKPNFKVASASLDLVGRTLSVVFADMELTKPSTVRSESWLKASKEQVRVSLNVFIGIRSHSRPEVRKSMLRLCELCISTSSVSLDNCLPALIDTVVFYMASNDLEYEARSILELHLSNSSLKNVLEERIYEWITSLPRLFTSHDDTVPVLILDSISAGLSLVDSPMLKELLCETMTSSVHLKSSSEVTKSLTKFDPTKLLAEQSLKTPTKFGFDNLDLSTSLSTETQKSLTHLLQSLGKRTDSELVLRKFLVWSAVGSTDLRVLPFWMATNVFKGMTVKSDLESDEWLVDNVSNADELVLSDAVQDLMSFSSEVIIAGTSAAQSSSPMQTSMIVVALDAVSAIAAHLGEEFDLELVDNLYPVVSYLGAADDSLRKQAQTTVSQIAKSCGYATVRDLLVENADYLVDGVAVKLNSLDISPQSTTLLSTLIKLTGSSITPYMNDLVATMFVILDNYHGYQTLTEGIFQVFETLVGETRKGYEGKLMIESGDDSDGLKRKIITSYDELIKELSYKAPEPEIEPVGPESHNNRPFGESKIEEVDSDDEDIDEEPEHGSSPMDTAQEQEEKEWSSVVNRPTYDTINKIVGYADLYLTHSSASLRYNLLELLDTAIPVLSTSEKEFLPVVNLYWPALVSKLDDSETFVLVKALDVIAATCENAKSFMTTRIEKVWPKLVALLPRDLNRQLPEFSDEKKRLDAVLNCIARILTHTPISVNLFDNFLHYMAPALGDSRYNFVLVALEKVNPDAVWLERMKLEQTHTYSLPKSSIEPPVQFFAY